MCLFAHLERDVHGNWLELNVVFCCVDYITSYFVDPFQCPFCKTKVHLLGVCVLFASSLFVGASQGMETVTLSVRVSHWLVWVEVNWAKCLGHFSIILDLALLLVGLMSVCLCQVAIPCFLVFFFFFLLCCPGRIRGKGGWHWTCRVVLNACKRWMMIFLSHRLLPALEIDWFLVFIPWLFWVVLQSYLGLFECQKTWTEKEAFPFHVKQKIQYTNNMKMKEAPPKNDPKWNINIFTRYIPRHVICKYL